MALRYIGDFPIVTSVLSDDYQAVREASRRRPRNEVARFILEDLDNAYELMLQTPPMTNRLTKDCAALNMSVSTLYRKSKANMGTAPIELIHQSRISAARDLLASGAYTIQEISEKVGYEDVRTLRKHFYRKFGIMPSQYRKNNAEPA